MSIEEIIEKHALKNAYDYGKADPGSIIGKVIGEMPDAKKDMKSLVAKVKETVKKVNAMSKSDIETAMSKFTYIEKKEEERKLHAPGLDLNVPATLRFAPEPGGYIHIGNAKAALLSYEIVKQSGGKMYLRFDDTNPDKSKQEFVDAIKRDLNWLKMGWDYETYTSDSMEMFYEYGTEMIRKGKAYVCECTPEVIRLGRREQKGCACRNKPLVQNLKDYERLLKGEFEEGKAIVRFRGDMKALNSVMRDPTLFRICKTPHFRQGEKYSVWPSYDFVCPILDSINGLTHALRGKEYELRDELYNAILDTLELQKPTIITISRLQIKNNTTAKRVIRDLIAKGHIKTWDDPRLVTVSGLRRRGVLSEAIREFVLSAGISKQESEAEIEQLLVENRKLLDPISPRHYFVRNPIAVRIGNVGDEEVKLRLHPTQDIGERTAKITAGVIYIDANDKPSAGDLIRLKDFCTIKVTEVRDGEVTAERVETEEMPEKKIQWVGDNKTLARVLKPGDLLIEDGENVEFNPNSLTIDEGICDKDCENLKDGDIVQFVRYGFVRKDGTEDGKMRFIFSC
jgi:glutamyl-tRNA synthetase